MKGIQLQAPKDIAKHMDNSQVMQSRVSDGAAA